jgi:hypothetical protein
MDIGELFEGDASQFGNQEYQDNDEAHVKAEEEAQAAAAANNNSNTDDNNANNLPPAKVQPRIVSRAQRLQMQQMQIQKAIVNAVSATLESQEAKLDSQLDKLENLSKTEIEEIHAKRMDELKRKVVQKEKWLSNAHGLMNEIPDQKLFFQHVKTSKHVICLFYNKSNTYCNDMTEHLTILARKHLECKFLKINVDNAPFLMSRLNIWMIPTLVCASNNKVDRQLRGLDWCAPDGKICTLTLERKLFEFGFLEETYMEMDANFKKYKKTKMNINSSAKKYASDSSDDLFD